MNIALCRIAALPLTDVAGFQFSALGCPVLNSHLSLYHENRDTHLIQSPQEKLKIMSTYILCREPMN